MNMPCDAIVHFRIGIILVELTKVSVFELFVFFGLVLANDHTKSFISDFPNIGSGVPGFWF